LSWRPSIFWHCTFYEQILRKNDKLEDTYHTRMMFLTVFLTVFVQIHSLQDINKNKSKI
jgi:hypothetical protein